VLRLVLSIAPLVGFYLAEAQWGLSAGVLAAMGLSGVDLTVEWVRHRRLNRLAVATAVLIVGLGGLTLLSNDERFVLYSPVVGDALVGGGLIGWTLMGRSPLLTALRELEPEVEVHPLQDAFLRGVALRFGLNLLVHAVITAIAAGQSRETWLLVSGPVMYGMMGVQMAGEVAWARLVLNPRIDEAERSEE
jgi:intracellular septation protein